MQRRLALLVALLALTALAPRPAARANASDLAYIKGKVGFLYSDDLDGRQPVRKNPDLGDRFRETEFNEIADVLVTDRLGNHISFTEADRDRFQAAIARILKITDAPVTVYLINDERAPRYRWIKPHANTHGDLGQLGSARVPAAWVKIGAFEMDQPTWGGWFSTLRTLCHEFMHTQDLSRIRPPPYLVFGHPPRFWHYGPGWNHAYHEALPVRTFTLKEALANLAGLACAPQGIQECAQWWVNDDPVVIDRHHFGPGTTGYIPPDVYAPDALARIRSTVKGEGWEGYPLSVLPTKTVLHNEWIITLVLFHLAPALKPGAVVSDATFPGFNEICEEVRRLNADPPAASSAAWLRLVQRLCERLSPTPAPRGMLPLALCDFFTRFSAKNEAELQALFAEAPGLKPWISAYAGTITRNRLIIGVSSWEADNPLAPTATAEQKAKRLKDLVEVIAKRLGYT